MESKKTHKGKIALFIALGVLIFVAIVFVIQLVMNANTAKNYSDTAIQVSAEQANEVKSVDIDMQYGNVTLDSGSNVSGNFHGDLDNFKYVVEDNTLKITQDKSGNFWVGLGVGVNLDNQELNLTVPDGLNIKIETNAGHLDVSGIKGDTLTSDSNAGNVTIENAEFNTVNCKTNAGNVKFNALTSKNVECKTNAGNITGDHNVIDTSTFKTNAGNVEINGTFKNQPVVKTDLGETKINGN
jgi:lia operon protein LiaG